MGSRARLNALPVSIMGILLMGFIAFGVTHESKWISGIILVVVVVGIVGEIYFALDEAKEGQKQ